MLKLGKALGGWSPGDAVAWKTDPVILIGAGWTEIVGPEVAQHSRPARIMAETLLITTRSSAWSQQLTFLSETIVSGIRTRLPDCGIERLRFRVGKLPVAGKRPHAQSVSRAPAATNERAAALDAEGAIAQFRSDVTAAQRAKRAAGWNECASCTAFIAPGLQRFCVSCANARGAERARFVSRVLFEAPWLGYAGVAELVDDLHPHEYASIRRSLLGRWWETLSRARATRKLSSNGRERLIASSFVILKSGLSPERIGPATVRNVLGDDLHHLIYGTETVSETHGQ